MVLVKIPSRSRPKKLYDILTKSIDMSGSINNIMYIISLDMYDKELHNYIKLIEKIPCVNIRIVIGISRSKIEAYNRDVDISGGWNILIALSDDMVCVKENWDNIIIDSFGNNLDQLIHFNDGFQKGNVSTLPIMGVDYYKRFGYIYNPEYVSLWCDAEQTEVAYMLDKYKYMGDDLILFKHVHPSTCPDEVVKDELYEKELSLTVQKNDEYTFNVRRGNMYYINPVKGFKYELDK